MEIIMNNKDYCVVIGGVNIDIGGRPDVALIQKDSNPGRITSSLGGVGRNIAHNMALLNIRIKLITALGMDANAERIKKSCYDLGIDIEGCLESSEDNTSSYMFIADETGDMEIAISDMNIYAKVTPDYLSTRMDEINKAKLVVVDTNIPTETINYLTENCKVPIYADPVSCTKALRLIPSLSKLHTITPNLLEAEVLTGIKIDSDEKLVEAGQKLLDIGVTQVFITLGANGLFAMNKDEHVKLPILPCKLVNATGAGDAMMAGMAYAGLKGLSLKETAKTGLAAAAIAVESAYTINSRMSEAVLNSRLV